jgi:hypothetical protein
MVTFYPGPKGQGQRVKASPLTLCPGNTRGSEPLQTIYEQQFACLETAKVNQYWVRGHLLHGKTARTGDRHLHGPGNTPANLIIITQSLNQQMRSWLEDAALKLVYGPLPQVLWMSVWVDSYVPGTDFFANAITIEYGPFRTATGAEGSAWNSRQFVDPKMPPHCPSGGPPSGPLGRPGAGVTGTYGFQSRISIHGGGRVNRLESRHFDVSKSMGGLSVAIDGQLVPPRCTVEYYYVELAKEKWGPDKHISKNRLSIYPHKERQLLVWRQLPEGEYYMNIWREDEGVFRRTPGCLLKGDITVDTFEAPAPTPSPSPSGEEIVRNEPSLTASGPGQRIG